jgi:RecJ-like exonuclease
MIKKICSITLFAVIAFSCNNNKSKIRNSSSSTSKEYEKVEFPSLVSNPEGFVGRNISIEGKVVRVSETSGKELYITGEDTDIVLCVQAGNEKPEFTTGLIGSEIIVEGTITRPDSTVQLSVPDPDDAGEKKTEEVTVTEYGSDTCDSENVIISQPVLHDLMMIYNKHIVIK